MENAFKNPFAVKRKRGRPRKIQTKKPTFVCCASPCPSDSLSLGLDFRRFPSDRSKSLELMTKINRLDLQEVPLNVLLQNYFVCSLHFEGDPPVTLEYIQAEHKSERQPISTLKGNAILDIQKSLARVEVESSLYSNDINDQQIAERIGSEVSPRKSIEPVQSLPTNLSELQDPCDTGVEDEDRTLPTDESLKDTSRTEVSRFESPAAASQAMLCEKCGRVFDTPKDYRRHLMESGDIPYEVESDIFTRERPKLKKRRLNEEEEEEEEGEDESEENDAPNMRKQDFKCRFCRRRFERKVDLVKHMMAYHKDLFCPHCFKTFKSRYYLPNHIANHCSKRVIA